MFAGRENDAVGKTIAAGRDAGIDALLRAVDERDHYTGQHSRCVVALSRDVASTLGMTPDEVDQVEQVALLHDVGKIAIPDRILLKPAALDQDEMEIVKRHPAIGAGIVSSIKELRHLAPAIRAGHERYDGRGYPDGLSGEKIPLASRITAVCDAYDAMISDRPYRRRLRKRQALDEVRRNAGTQFCPRAAVGLTIALGGSRVPAGAAC
jgi:HD-GYP domain-containing protein (c-di-GMP phosphodiesterase class II)